MELLQQLKYVTTIGQQVDTWENLSKNRETHTTVFVAVLLIIANIYGPKVFSHKQKNGKDSMVHIKSEVLDTKKL